MKGSQEKQNLNCVPFTFTSLVFPMGIVGQNYAIFAWVFYSNFIPLSK